MDPAREPQRGIDPIARLDSFLALRGRLDRVRAGDDLKAASCTRAVLTAGARDREPDRTGRLEEGHLPGFDLELLFGGQESDSARHRARV